MRGGGRISFTSMRRGDGSGLMVMLLLLRNGGGAGSERGQGKDSLA